MVRNKLAQLIRDNAKARAKAPFRAESTGENEVTLYVYDVIVATDEEAAWWGGVSAESFVKELAGITAGTIHLRINSPGGDVFAARAMEAAVRGCKSRVIAHVDGYAASAASYLALACDEVEIIKGGFFMIHKAWSFAWGNCDDLVAVAELLEKIDETLVDTYADETGQDKDQIREWMTAETWFNSDEAIQYGFADRLAGDAVKANASWNLAVYANAPELGVAEKEERAPEVAPAAAMSVAPQAPPIPAPDEAAPAPAQAFDQKHFDDLQARLMKLRANRR